MNNMKTREISETGSQLATRSWVSANIKRMIDERYAEVDKIVKLIDFDNLEVLCNAYRLAADRISEVERDVNMKFTDPFNMNLPKMMEQVKFCDMSFLSPRWFDEFAPAQHGHDASSVFLNGVSINSVISNKADKSHTHKDYITKEQVEDEYISKHDIEDFDFSEDIEGWYDTNAERIVGNVKDSIKAEKVCETAQPQTNQDLVKELTIEIKENTKDTQIVYNNNNQPVNLKFKIFKGSENGISSFKVSIPNPNGSSFFLTFTLADRESGTQVKFNWDKSSSDPINSPCVFDFELMNNVWWISKREFNW